MNEVLCVRISLKPGSAPLVREWAVTLNETSRSEALTTMTDEGVSVESYFLDASPDGDHLVAYMRGVNLDQAALIASKSNHDIDRYHREFKRRAWGDRVVLEPLVDLVVTPEAG